MSNFFDILAKYSTWEHVSNGCDKNTHHSYGDTYEKILNNLKDKQDIDILEIGISSGAFLQVMSELLPNANIYGIDTSLECIKFGKDNPKIHMFQMDGTNEESATIIGKHYDLITDDASHNPLSQIRSFEIFAPYIKNGGTYIIEDIQPNIDKQYFQNSLRSIASKNNMDMEWLDLSHVKNTIDDILVIFTKTSD